MHDTHLSSSTTAQLLSLGIPASKHRLADLRLMIPPFDGLKNMTDVETLAGIVVYLGKHNLLTPDARSWKSLPWGTHACIFYKSHAELIEPFKNFFREGLLAQEKCVWVIPKFYNVEKAAGHADEWLDETGMASKTFEIIQPEDWYENGAGRFRAPQEILTGWLNKIESAIQEGYKGLRVAGDAHFHPDDLKDFFAYEGQVHGSISSLKIKALCAYCIPKFPAAQIQQIFSTHQSLFGDFALCGK